MRLSEAFIIMALALVAISGALASLPPYLTSPTLKMIHAAVIGR